MPVAGLHAPAPAGYDKADGEKQQEQSHLIGGGALRVPPWTHPNPPPPNDGPSTSMAAVFKAAVRAQVQAAIKTMPLSARTVESARVCERLVAHPAVQAASHVGVYVAMASEVNLATALPGLASKQLYVPRIEGRQMTLEPMPRSEDAMQRHASGFLQPVAAGADDPARVLELLDVLVVPGRAFDRRGRRVGRGGGYYDRIVHELRALRPQRMPVLIGVAFGVQRVGVAPTEAHDVAMDAVLFGDEEGAIGCPAHRALVVAGTTEAELIRAGLTRETARSSPTLVCESVVRTQLERLQASFLEAGVDVLATNTRSLSVTVVDAAEILRENAALARSVVERHGGLARVALVLGECAPSVPAMDAMSLLALWRTRVACARECREFVDLWSVEAIPDALECRAIVAALAEVPQRPPVWLTFACGGEALAECVRVAGAARGVVAAVGICSHHAGTVDEWQLTLVSDTIRASQYDLQLVCMDATTRMPGVRIAGACSPDVVMQWLA